MSTRDHSLPERRAALVRAAQRVTAESGPEAGALLDPDLARDVAIAVAQDIAQTIAERTAGARTLDALVDGLLDGVLEPSERWRDALPLANVAVERVADFDGWAGLLAPWLDAVERVIATGQERGLVRRDIDPQSTALVLRDALDRTAKVEVRFRRSGYRDATAALVRGALAPDGD